MAPAKTPITVVTGFLGAGKTTFVNHILRGNHGKRIAVIENEFGEVGIDDALVLETKEEIFEMNNGCMCCTVRGDLIRILNKLLARRNKFDAILIETTGLADPAAIIQTFFVDEDLKDACALDAVLTLVDAKHVMQHLDEEKPDGVVNEAIQQVAFADKILLNKLDLVSEEEKQAVIRRVRNINHSVDIFECTNSQVDLERVLGISAFDMDKLLQQDPHFLDEGKHHGHSSDSDDDHSHHDDDHSHHDDDHSHHKDDGAHGGHGHTHDDRVSSVGIEAGGSCDMRKLNAWLSTLLRERGADLYRSKGILSVHGSDERHVFQGVHMLLQFHSSAEGVGRPWGPTEERVNKLVFIGKELNREELNSSFRACLVSS